MENRQHLEKSLLEEFLPTEPSTFEFLPWLDVPALIKLMSTCKGMHGLFTNNLRDILLDKLMVICANIIVNEPSEKNIEILTKILNIYPDLMLKKIKKVTDQSGRTIIHSTLFQLAYGAGDDVLCLLLKPFFTQACCSEAVGIEEMRHQFNKKFAEKSNDKAIKEHLEKLLATVIQAISNERFDHGLDGKKWILSDETLEAIKTFRKEFAATQPKIIDKGMHFRLETLLEVCEEYIKAAKLWKYDYKKSALFEDGVLSFVLGYEPINDVQRFNQGLYYLQNLGKEFKRSGETRDKHNFYHALRYNSAGFVLDGSSIDIIYGERGVVAGRRGRGPLRAHVAKLMSSKKFKLAELMPSQSIMSRCVIL